MSVLAIFRGSAPASRQANISVGGTASWVGGRGGGGGRVRRVSRQEGVTLQSQVPDDRYKLTAPASGVATILLRELALVAQCTVGLWQHSSDWVCDPAGMYWATLRAWAA